jgi:hypothetical protein
MGNRDAINQALLGSLIEALPGLFCAIGDCAYTPSEHLVPMCQGDMAKMARYNNFNFFASQLQIQIEMAFGLMVKKWGILVHLAEVRIGRTYSSARRFGFLHWDQLPLQKKTLSNLCLLKAQE